MRDSIRLRVFVALLVTAILGAAVLSVYFLREIEAYGQRRLEERLGTQARITSVLVGSAYEKSGSDRPLTARRPFALGAALTRAYPTRGTSVRVLDGHGVVVADSSSTGSGATFAAAPEVRRALAGTATTASRTDSGGRFATFVADPIIAGGKVVGVAYASSSTFSTWTLIRDYRWQLLLVVAVYLLAALAVAELLSRFLTRPLADLARAATAYAGGDFSARVRPSGPSETRALAEAMNTMAGDVSRSLDDVRAEERRKSRFVSDVSHELRTPLTSIRGAAETLLEDEDVPADMRDRFLATIVSESDRLSRLANDLLALERIEGATGEIALGRVDLLAVVEHTVSTLEPLMEERGVRVDVIGEPAYALGERDRLQQVVANLVDNASRMTPEGGTVTVHVGRQGPRVRVAIADQGPGIAPEDIDRVFDRFWRAQYSRDRSTGGAGLGLSIVKAIIERHAGEIGARNLPEGGAEFFFELPAVER
jgi:two-component system OmpR family sensor kinase